MSELHHAPHEALCTVLGEMWHELQKLDGTHQRVSLIMDIHGSKAYIRGSIQFVDCDDKLRTVVGPMIEFRDMESWMDTTMIFRSLPRHK